MACGSCGILSFGKKRRSRRSRRGSKRRSGRKNRATRRTRRHRRSRMTRRRSRRFGIVSGPGFKGQTSYTNAYSPYFGSYEPFISSSQWWYPYTGGVAQSPQMLVKTPGLMKGPGN